MDIILKSQLHLMSRSVISTGRQMTNLLSNFKYLFLLCSRVLKWTPSRYYKVDSKEIRSSELDFSDLILMSAEKKIKTSIQNFDTPQPTWHYYPLDLKFLSNWICSHWTIKNLENQCLQCPQLTGDIKTCFKNIYKKRVFKFWTSFDSLWASFD